MKYLFILLFTFLLYTESNAGVAIVVNKNSSINSIDKNTVSELYRMNIKTVGGVNVKLLTQMNNSVAQKFFQALGLDQDQIKKIWLKKKLTGAGNPPTPESSDSDVINKVSGSTDTIGFVSSDKVGDNVKVLLVID